MRRMLITGCIGMAIVWQAALQRIAAGQQVSSSSQKLQPLSLQHLYLHFLVYVNVLDRKAAVLTAEGQNGNWLRNDLQTKLHFSDTDFAPIRISSERLTSELAILNQQAKTILSAGPPATTAPQMKAVMAKRETYIDNEIVYLGQSLSPQKQATLEAFMMQFFAPKTLSFQSSGSTSQPAGQAGTQ